MKKIKAHTDRKKGNLSINELKRLYHETIKGKITISVLALVIISLTVLGIVTSVLNNHSTNSTLERNMKATARVASERVEWEMTSYRNLAADLGLMTRLSREDVPLEEKQEMDYAQRCHVEYTENLRKKLKKHLQNVPES